MRKTLVINSGSSSLKYKLYSMPGYEVDCEGIVDRIGIDGGELVIKFADKKEIIKQDIENHEQGIELLLKGLEKYEMIKNKEEITKIGHRVVQGGEIFKSSSLIDDDALAKIYDLVHLAPLHNKANADGISIFKKLIPTAINVAVFDTEFHQTMPKESYLYPVPYDWYEKYSVRRYGMHGTSHKYITHAFAEKVNKPVEELKIINCHLGNGASLCAIDGGKSIQTSMGLTPLAGIMMGTRCGDIDPSIIEFMNKETGQSIEEITEILNKKSGMLGVSGVSSDFRDVGAAIDAGNERAILGMELYITRIVETIGAYYLRLQGLDGIVFTGGIGENDDLVRTKIIEGLEVLGVTIDETLNKDRSLGDRAITSADSKFPCWVIATDEEYQIAKETENFA